MSKQTNAQASEAERLLSQYRNRLAAEGWIKSALCGLTIGFVLHILYTLVCLVFGIKLFWVGILLFALGAATIPLFYFTRFKNSTRQVASRVDTLGLEERVLTMAQLEGDDSFMARRQREDTIQALKTVNASLLKIAVSVPLIVLCATTCALSATAVTANALVDKSLIEIVDEAKKDADTSSYEVVYEVKDEIGGVVVGELTQTIKAGQTGSPVQAIADDGYVFVGWTDGFESAFRADTNVRESFRVSAVFAQIDEEDLPDPTDDDTTGDDPAGTPPTPSDGSSGVVDSIDDPSDGGDPGEGGGVGGSSSPSNQVVDGQTYYGNEYGNSLSDAQDAMNGNTDLSGGQSDTIGDYFNNIAK